MPQGTGLIDEGAATVEGSEEIEQLADTVSQEIARTHRRLRRVADERHWRRLRMADPARRARRRLAVLLPVLATLLGIQAAPGGPFSAPRRPASESIRQVHEAVLFGAQRVQAHRSSTGSLPASLDELGLLARDGWRYERLDSDAFRLGLRYERWVAQYESGTGRIVVSPQEEVS